MNHNHDPRTGRFVSIAGIYNPDEDKDINYTAKMLTEYWQEHYSEIEGTYDYSVGTYIVDEEAEEEEYDDMYYEFKGFTKDLYKSFYDKMNERIAEMDADELREYSRTFSLIDGVSAEVLREYHDNDEFVEMAVERVAEDYSSKAANMRYQQIVRNTRGRKNLFDLAYKESDTDIYHGYATDRIKAEGLEGEYSEWREKRILDDSIREDYRNNKPIGKKPASFYVDEDAYVRAKYRSLNK